MSAMAEYRLCRFPGCELLEAAQGSGWCWRHEGSAEELIRKAIEDEREACAQAVEAMTDPDVDSDAAYFAAAIRARGAK